MTIIKQFNQNLGEPSDPTPLNTDLETVINFLNNLTTTTTSIQGQMTGYSDGLEDHMNNVTDAHDLNNKADLLDFNNHILNTSTAHGLDNININTDEDIYQIHINVKKKGANGLGLTSDAASIYSAITEASTGDYSTIYFPAGTYKISSDLTFPSNVTIKFANRAILSVDSGITVTINGCIDAGLYQIFSGNGTITGTPKIDVVYPQWFGVIGDRVTDNTTAWQKMVDTIIDSVGSVYIEQKGWPRTVYIPPGLYLIDGKVTHTDGITYIGEPAVFYTRYNHYGGSVILATGTSSTDYVFEFDAGSGGYMRGVRISNISFLGSDEYLTATSSVDRPCLHFKNNITEVHLDKVQISGFLRRAIYGDALWDGTWNGVRILYCGTNNTYPAVEFVGNCNALHIFGLHIEKCPSMLRLGATTRDCQFVGCKFEYGLTMPLVSPIEIKSTSLENNFIGCHFTYCEGSAGGVYMIDIDNDLTTITDSTFSCESPGSMWIKHTGNYLNVSDSIFNMCYADDYFMDLGYGAVVEGNYMVNTTSATGKRYGIKMAGWCKMDNKLYGGSGTVCTEGNLFYGTDINNEIKINLSGTYLNIWDAVTATHKLRSQVDVRGQLATTFTDGDTTPSVRGGIYFLTANTSPTSITNFTNGTTGKTIKIHFNDANTSLIHNTDTMILEYNVDFAGAVGDFIELSKDIDNKWYETNRRYGSPRHIYPINIEFLQENVAANQTNVQLSRPGTIIPTKMINYAGSITSIGVYSSEVRTAGTLTVEVYNYTTSTASGLTAVLDGTNTAKKVTTQAAHLDTFAATERIGVRITTSSDWAPITADIEVEVICKLVNP